MTKLGHLLLSVCALALPCLGQTLATVSYRNIQFVNTSGNGSAIVPARVHYPAISKGVAQPIVPRDGGHPVVVFMHGYGLLGKDYGNLAAFLSARGYVVVLGNTARMDEVLQLEDTRALYWALAAANGNPSHKLYGALDMQNVGLAGHSMGGRNAFRMFIYNPGYAAVVAIAPVFAGSLIMPLVDVPFGIIHGEGDPTVPWQDNGWRNYVDSANFTGLKFFYLLDSNADHHNVTGLVRALPLQPIWEISAGVMTGFFDRTLQGEHAALEMVVGPTSRSEPRLTQLNVMVQSPDLWTDRAGAPGRTSRFSILAERGAATLFAAAATAAVATPFGLLELDPSTIVVVTQGVIGKDRLLSWSLSLPNVSALIGAQIPFQGIGIDNADRLVWTNLSVFAIE